MGPGDKIGRLEVVEELGRGARGVVYKAYDARLARHVAVKLIRDTGDEEAYDIGSKRFVKEAQAMAAMTHSNVVGVHDVNSVEIEGRVRVYIEMEYVEGRSLAEQITSWHQQGGWRRGKLWRGILSVFVAAGRGLAAAHDRGLIHRDFKPANVLLDDQGRARVTDFGLVRQSDELEDARAAHGSRPQPGLILGLALTQTRALVGTPAYMAPEQFAGLDGNASVDQFAFCVALWEALYGQRPFPGAELGGLARAVLEDPPRRPADAPPVSRFVHRALERGLSKDPNRRYPDMHALLATLEAAPRRAALRVAGMVGATLGVVVLGLGVHRFVQPGQLDITIDAGDSSLDGLSVSIDGQLPEPAHSRVLTKSLSAGSHTVRVELPGHYPFAERVELDRDEPVELVVELVRETGFVDVAVAPSETEFVFDGRPRGVPLAVGSHDLRVRSPGSHEARLRFDLGVDERAELTAYLAPGIVYQARGGGLALGRGALGDADGDGHVDIWDLDYATLTAHSPLRAGVLWRKTISTDSHAMFLHMVDLDGDDVVDPLVFGVADQHAALRAWRGTDASELWRAEAPDEGRAARPPVPPVLVQTEAGLAVVVVSLEQGMLAAYAGASGVELWRTSAFEGPSFGLVELEDSDQPAVVVAHVGGVSRFDLGVEAPRWTHSVPGFDTEWIARLREGDTLANYGREGARSWLVSAALDDEAGDDLVLPAFAADAGVVDEDRGPGGPLLALSGARGELLWQTTRAVRWPGLRELGDLDGDRLDELAAFVRNGPPNSGWVVFNGRDGEAFGRIRAGEALSRCPADGPARVFGAGEHRIYSRSIADEDTREGLDIPSTELRGVYCADWDADAQPEILVATVDQGVHALDVSGRNGGRMGTLAMDRPVNALVPLGDMSGDGRPDFLLEAAGPVVVLGSRVEWARSFPAELRAAPLVVDIDGDGALDIAVFNGQQSDSRLELLAARDGRRLAATPSGEMAVHAPTLVPESAGLPGRHDLVYPSPGGRVVRVHGDTFEIEELELERPIIESYAGIEVSPDGRHLWVVGWKDGPHLRELVREGERWVGGFELDATFGSKVQPRYAQLDEDPALELLAVVDHGRLVALDLDDEPAASACAWSRWTTAAGLGRGPLIVDLDGDGISEIVTPMIETSEQPASMTTTCMRPHAKPEQGSLDLVALDGSGALRWRVAAAGSALAPAIIHARGSSRELLAIDDRGTLRAIRLTGEVRWTVDKLDPPSTPLLLADLDGDGRAELVYGTATGEVHVLDARDGQLRWTWMPPEPAPQRAPLVAVDIDDDGLEELLVATGAGMLFALDGTAPSID